MADFDTAAWQEAERRYPDKGGCYEEHARHAYARAAFEAGARWGAERADPEVRRLNDALGEAWVVALSERSIAAREAQERRDHQARAERAEAALAEVAALARQAVAHHAPDCRDTCPPEVHLAERILARAEQTEADR